MLRGLWKLTWLELKIFAREPLGLIGTLLIPPLSVVVLGRIFGRIPSASPRLSSFVTVDLPVFAAVFTALNAVQSLVTIVSIYREGGILKRLRATPLRPQTILSAQVLVKLILTAATLALTVLAGRNVLRISIDLHLISFAAALLFSTLSILSIGFLLASLVPTARFAQPVASLVLYPMLFLSGLFFPVDGLPAGLQIVARVIPLRYAVSLLKGIWVGEAWLAHAGDVAALVTVAVVFAGLSARVFRWE
ncbi:MAG: ABC transporter permease [Acidobacteria bacterium]|nr:ABC transporter permease [Acidobacteriota bacterium]